MFLDRDYNAFHNIWLGYNQSFNIPITDDDCLSFFNMVKDFAPCTIDQFVKQIRKNIAFGIAPNQTSFKDLTDLASFDGRTREQIKAHVSKLWRVFNLNLDIALDYCFSDLRFCIAIYLSFGTVEKYLDFKDKKDKENLYFKLLLDNYIGCSINDNFDIIQNYSIQQGWQKSDPRRVVIIGDHADGVKICDRFFGTNHWKEWRNDIYNQYYHSHFKKLDLQSSIDHIDRRRECLDLMEKVIKELEGKPTDLMIEDRS